jgi:endoribonuclease Dicer
MTQNNRPLTTLEIAKAIGLTTKRDVNSALYAMERAGVIQRVKYQPPVWSLRGRRDPGVIGEERNLNEPSRRKSFNEGLLSNRRNRSRSEHERQAEILKPRSKSFHSEGDSSSIKSCGLCKISFTSKQQSDEHFQSTKHQNKIAKVTSEPYLKFCEYCKVHLNSKSQANEHFTSGRHEQTVAKSQKAPIRHHPPLRTPSEGFNPEINTETAPFGYQVELYYKAMSANSVCFLPTGTGKTLVAALVVAHLLQLNPSRQIIFLVDRVLLVIQQSDYLKNELKNVQIPVSAKDEGQNTTKPSLNGRQYAVHGKTSLRPVRIGAICGEMRKLEQGVPIFNHDVLVVTADCYRNHINNGTLRFEDSALIVLDESHHCNKDHPYNVIVRDYYLIEDISLSQKPKILGLTASPAGEPTLERTVKKMQRLLANLGGASLLTVTENIPELTKKTSQTEMVCYCADYTRIEEDLLALLMEYATKCFNLAARLSDFKEYKDVFQPSAGGVLSKDDIYPILGVIDNLLNSPKSETANAMNSLVHFEIICDCICTLQECGEKVAFDRMAELVKSDCQHGFDWAESQGLPCEKISAYLQQRFVES